MCFGPTPHRTGLFEHIQVQSLDPAHEISYAFFAHGNKSHTPFKKFPEVMFLFGTDIQIDEPFLFEKLVVQIIPRNADGRNFSGIINRGQREG